MMDGPVKSAPPLFKDRVSGFESLAAFSTSPHSSKDGLGDCNVLLSMADSGLPSGADSPWHSPSAKSPLSISMPASTKQLHPPSSPDHRQIQLDDFANAIMPAHRRRVGSGSFVESRGGTASGKRILAPNWTLAAVGNRATLDDRSTELGIWASQSGRASRNGLGTAPSSSCGKSSLIRPLRPTSLERLASSPAGIPAATASSQSLSPANAAFRDRANSASPRLPVSSIISLYNSPHHGSSPASAVSSAPGYHHEGPLDRSPISERSLDHFQAIQPSPMASRPASPAKSVASSTHSGRGGHSHNCSKDDDLLALLLSRRPGQAPATPPRPTSPNPWSSPLSASTSSLVSKPSPPLHQPADISSAVSSATSSEASASSHSRFNESDDMISFHSPTTPQPPASGKQPEWTGLFTVEPPTPNPHAGVLGAERLGTWPPSPRSPRGSASDPYDTQLAVTAFRASLREGSPGLEPPASAEAACRDAEPKCSTPPKLPPRRASATSLRSSANALPPDLPPRPPVPRRQDSEATEKARRRRSTQGSFHSISLSSDGESGPGAPATTEWETPRAMPVLPPPQRRRTICTPAMTAKTVQADPPIDTSLSSFNRAPLPPPRRRPTLSSANLSPTSSTTSSSSRSLKGKGRETEQSKARDRYEALWEAQCAVEERRGRGPSPGEGRRLVAVVIGQLWSRSGLSQVILSRIWRACDREGRGSLDQESFVKGMAMIDDELRRRQHQRQRQTLLRRPRPSLLNL